MRVTRNDAGVEGDERGISVMAVMAGRARRGDELASPELAGKEGDEGWIPRQHNPAVGIRAEGS